MLNIAVYSDLHIEHSSLTLDVASADVVVLAGDIFALGAAYNKDFSVVHWIDQNIADKPIIFVPGNHDFENSCWERQLNVWKDQASMLGGRIHVLWDEIIDLNGVRFLGTPLFSDFASTGHPEVVKEHAKRICDFRSIFHSDGHPVRPDDYIHWNHKAREFLHKQLQHDPDMKKIVVTHFAPSLKLRDPSRPAELLDAYWLNDCEDLVGMADIWISGHSHYSCDITLDNGGRMISNARGVSKMYGLSGDQNFNPAFRVQLNTHTNKIKL